MVEFTDMRDLGAVTQVKFFTVSPAAFSLWIKTGGTCFYVRGPGDTLRLGFLAV